MAAVAVAAMLLVRRRAPEGSYFEDGDRAAGVFGVLATGFAVLLGFVVFLAFQSFDTSRSGAETEAQIVAAAVRDGPADARRRRAAASRASSSATRASVVHQEWPRMESGTLTDGYNPWGSPCSDTLKTVEPHSASEQAAYGKWLDQRTDRETARADRTHGAEGVIPTPLWIVLFLSAGIIFVFMLFFADSGERAIVQATMMGSVAVVITSTLLLLWFLDNPYSTARAACGRSRWRAPWRLTQDTGIAASDHDPVRRARKGRYEMTATRRTSTEEAQRVGDQIGVDWSRFDLEQSRAGMDVEFEHGSHDPQTDVTHDDPIVTGKIALAHMKEFPDYYERLEQMESEAERDWAGKLPPN